MALAFLVTGIVGLTTCVVWEVSTLPPQKTPKILIIIIVIVALACILMSFILALGGHA